MTSSSLRESIELAHMDALPVESYTTQEDAVSPEQEEHPGASDDCNMIGGPNKPESSTNESLLPQPQPPYRRFWERVGKFGLSILIIGTLLLLGCQGILLFLWIGADRASTNHDPGSVWQTIAFSDWIARPVTISSAVARAAIMMQAVVVASMISAQLLESANTELYHLPLLSITRAFRLSPCSLLQSKILRKRPPKATYSRVVSCPM